VETVEKDWVGLMLLPGLTHRSNAILLNIGILYAFYLAWNFLSVNEVIAHKAAKNNF